MSCSFITKGRTLPICNNNLGGIKAVSFLDFKDGVSDLITTESGFTATVASFALSGSTDIFRYEVKNDGNTYVETSETDPNNYTTIYTGELKVLLGKITQDDIHNIQLLSYNRPQIFVEYKNGDVIFIGAEYGSVLTQSIKNSGGNMKDLQSIELSFKTEESKPYSYLSSSAITTYKSKISSSNITVD